MKVMIFFLLLIFNVKLYASTLHLKCEPHIVVLEGKLDLQTFPGPPNYESIQNGDEIERHFYLSLKMPVNVLKMRDDKYDEVTKNVKILQLVVANENQYSILRKLGVGAKVKISGTLFKRFTGHHHSRVLLQIKNLKHIF
jgi:hypothetical protein